MVLPHLADALAFARWLTGNPDDAEDVVQEACLRALSGIGTYAGGNARAWLLSIVRNTAATWVHRNRPTGFVDVADLLERDELVGNEMTGDAGLEGPEAALIAQIDAAELEAAIEALPPLYREALVLRDVNGLSYREISEVVAVPVGTVMSRLSRARAILISKLGGAV